MNANRRDFIRTVGCGALGAAAFVTGVERFYLAQAFAQAPANDYRALVCVFLFGGNDANNMVVPVDDYGSYSAVRGSLTVPQAQLLAITPPSDGRRYGLHPSMTRLHAKWQSRALAILPNVGPLIAPLTRAEYQSMASLRPYQLFSHSDQQTEWQTAVASGPVPTGWGGRIADITQNPSVGLPTIATVAGVTVFSTGATATPLALPPAPTPLPQALGLNEGGGNPGTTPIKTILDLASRDSSPTLVRLAAETASSGVSGGGGLTTDPVLTTIFPGTGLGNQLKQVAKLIKLSRAAGERRQIFFTSIGGFDTHTNQGTMTGAQPSLLQQVSDALAAFHDATVEIGSAPNVTAFTMSDFSRTFAPAGTGAETGTDHAWGGHQFVLGGAVRGGDFYGRFPTLALNGPDDTDRGNGARGRWIPTTSVDQLASTLALWFGVAPAALTGVLPNIGRFATPNLGFLG
jgi:uncharacterized protein (DUF1501 family)